MPDKLLVPFKHEGLWWKPDLPGERIAGTLSYDPVEGSNLSLLGQFGGLKKVGDPLSEKLPVIHGITKDTGEVTLFDNFSTSFRLTVPGISTEAFSPSFVFLGKLVDSPETYITPQCEFRLTNLEEWLDHRPFSIQFSQGEPKSLDLNVLLPEQQSFSLPHITSTLKAAASFQTRGGRVREFGVEVLSWLILEPNQPQTLQAHLKVISRIRNFVALCLGQRVYISNLVLRGAEEEVAPGKTQKRKIECYFQQNPSPTTPDKKTHLLGMTINDLGKAKSEIINKWFSLYDDIGPTLDILFSVLYTEMYLDVRFLLAAQAVESLHRRLWPSNYVDEMQYEEIEQKLADNIPNEVPSDLKAKLKDVLKYGNEFSLRRRLKEISQRLMEKGAENIVCLDSAFINDVVNTRNYLTHYDKSLQASEKREESLYRLYAKLALTVMVVVFTELGASKELIMEKLRHRRDIGHYVGT